jgi:hypothetical protein
MNTHSREDDALRMTLSLGLPYMTFLLSMGMTAFVERR